MEVTLILGVLIGIVLGLTGAGGGILAVPALVVGLGWSMQQAAPVALIAVAGGAALGAVDGLRKGLVRYKAALLMVLVGVPFTSAGIRLAHNLPQRWILGLFALVVLVAAARLLRQVFTPLSGAVDADHCLAHIDTGTGRFHWSWLTGLLFGTIGAVTGFMTGLLGVGGGFVVVPMLRRFTDVSMHGIVATSLMVVALVGVGGVISALAHGAVMPMPATALFAASTAIGMLVGRRLVAHVSERHIQLCFALLLITVAMGLLAKVATGA